MIVTKSQRQQIVSELKGPQVAQDIDPNYAGPYMLRNGVPVPMENGEGDFRNKLDAFRTRVTANGVEVIAVKVDGVELDVSAFPTYAALLARISPNAIAVSEDND